MSIKIALAGAGGTGKGTLGVKLAKELNRVFIASHIFDTGKMLNMEDYMDKPDKYLAYQYAIMFGQIYQERALQIAGVDYIAERSVYDYIPYFLEKGLEDMGYIQTILKWGASAYDLIIFLEPEFTPPDKVENSWKEREDKNRLKTSETIKEWLSIGYHGKVIYPSGNTEQRLKYVLSELKKISCDEK